MSWIATLSGVSRLSSTCRYWRSTAPAEATGQVPNASLMTPTQSSVGQPIRRGRKASRRCVSWWRRRRGKWTRPTTRPCSLHRPCRTPSRGRRGPRDLHPSQGDASPRAPRRAVGHGCGRTLMARIAWVEDEDASGEIADLYRELKRTSSKGNVPDILRTMSLRPDFLRAIDQASRLHFTDGALSRAEHEMIASYVSALNR